jgi:hypothetical protein
MVSPERFQVEKKAIRDCLAMQGHRLLYSQEEYALTIRLLFAPDCFAPVSVEPKY